MAPPPVRLACRDAAESRPARSSGPCHVLRAPKTTAGRSLVAPASALRAAHHALIWLGSSLVAWRPRSRRVWRRPDVASVLGRSFQLFSTRLPSGVGTRGAAGFISPRARRPLRVQRSADDAACSSSSSTFLSKLDDGALLDSGLLRVRGQERRRRDASGIAALADARRSPLSKRSL